MHDGQAAPRAIEPRQHNGQWHDAPGTTGVPESRPTHHQKRECEPRSPAAQRLVFSRRLVALANAIDIQARRDSKTQKSCDLARRKAVGCNTVLDGDCGIMLHNANTCAVTAWLCVE